VDIIVVWAGIANKTTVQWS